MGLCLAAALWGCEAKREAPKPLPIALPSTKTEPTPPPALYVELFHRRPVPKGTRTNIDAAETACARRPSDPMARRTLGLAYYAGGGYEAAARTLKAVVQRVPDDRVAWLYLGYCHMALADYTAALAALEHVSSAEAELQMGNIYFQALYKDAEAERHYRLAQEKAPQDGEPWLALGLLQASQGKKEEARKLLEGAQARLSEGALRETARAALAKLR